MIIEKTAYLILGIAVFCSSKYKKNTDALWLRVWYDKSIFILFKEELNYGKTCLH